MPEATKTKIAATTFSTVAEVTIPATVLRLRETETTLVQARADRGILVDMLAGSNGEGGAKIEEHLLENIAQLEATIRRLRIERKMLCDVAVGELKSEVQGISPMTPEQAGWRLAVAHRTMIEKDAKDHAQALAGALASAEEVLVSYEAQFETLIPLANKLQDQLQAVAQLIGALATAVARKDDNRALGILAGLVELAATYHQLDPLPATVKRPQTLREAWPDVFDPKGNPNG